MQLHLKNIGPIDAVDININSDLTFIYGENNIGKSYAITILYLTLKYFAFNHPVPSRYLFSPTSRILFNDDNLLKDTKSKLENMNEFDITDNVIRYFSSFLTGIFLSDFKDALHNSFGDISNLKNKISNEELYIGIEFENYFIHITEKNNELFAKYDCKGIKYLCKKAKQHRYPRVESNQVILYFTEEEQFIKDIQVYFNKIYKDSVLSILSIINNIYYLPASRSGLYRALNAFSQILAELAKKRKFVNQKIVLPSISEQDSDYFSKINEINIRRKNLNFDLIAGNIEEKLLKEKVSFDQE